MDVTSLVQGVLGGQRRSIARAISMVEDRQPEARALLSALHVHGGRAHRIGVTGAPGTGKSTLIGQLARAYRQHGVQVGVVAVDPTSPFSGGALLGDRVRMGDLVGDPGVFIRSMATRGALGGLAAATSGAVLILDAAGHEVILIETVGAGQDEVAIARTAHTTVVVDAPGLGDDIQVLKAGLIEIADVLVVNKADREGADQLVYTLEAMLDLGGRAWKPPVCKTVALDGTGTDDLVSAIEAHRAHLVRSHGAREDHRRVRAEVEQLLERELLTRFVAGLEPGKLDEVVSRIVARDLSPSDVLRELGLEE